MFLHLKKDLDVAQRAQRSGAWIPLVPWRILLAIAALYPTIAALAWLGHRLMRTGKSLTVILTALLMVPFGAFAAIVHLAVFDPLFLRQGAIDHSTLQRRDTT